MLLVVVVVIKTCLWAAVVYRLETYVFYYIKAAERLTKHRQIINNEGVHWPTLPSIITELDHQDIHWPHMQTQIAVCIKPQIHIHTTDSEPSAGSKRVTKIWKKKKTWTDSLLHQLHFLPISCQTFTCFLSLTTSILHSLCPSLIAFLSFRLTQLLT